MKRLNLERDNALRSLILFAGYLGAAVLLLLGAQEFVHRQWGIILSEHLVDSIRPVAGYLYELCGWTLVGFVPMGALLLWFTIRKLSGLAGPKDEGYCRWINELSVGLGLLGTIRGFIVVASQQGGTLGGGPNETLAAILVGMGSTFVGIALAVWAVLLQTPEDS